MTKLQFKQLKTGDYVKVITCLFGFSLDANNNLLISKGLGPWIGKIYAKNNAGVAYIEFKISQTGAVFGLHSYLEIVGKTKSHGFLNT